MPPPKWRDRDDKRLLVSLLATHTFKFKYNAIASHMGDGRTGTAIKRRIHRIKLAENSTPASTLNDTDEEDLKAEDDVNDPDTPLQPPTKKRRGRPPKKSPRAKGTNADSVNGTTGERGVSGASSPIPTPTPTPTKKPRVKAQVKTKVTPLTPVKKGEDTQEEVEGEMKMETDT